MAQTVTVPVLELKQGDIIYSPRGERVTVHHVTKITPSAVDALSYSDYRGGLKPYASVAYDENGARAFHVKDLTTTYDLWEDEDGRRQW